MLHAVSIVLALVGALGVAILAVQLAAAWRHLRPPPSTPPDDDVAPGISILKPLCGADDQLAENLEAFASLPYPRYELLLGVEHEADPAVSFARAVAARHPGRVRIIPLRGRPGLNPKVNQLIGLAAAARHGIVVVSDSNIRPPAGYLEEIARELGDPRVGLVTHAIVGGGERTVGSILDGLYLSCQAAPGVIAAQRVAGRDIVVGKSMALRTSDLERLGGFAAVKDVLAEDYVLGQMISERLHKQVRIGRVAVTQITEHRSFAAFVSRSLRWAIIHKHAVPPAAYAGVILLHPLVFLGAAMALEPMPVVGALAAARLALDAAAAKLTRGSVPGPRALALLPLRDLVHGAVWLRALAGNTVDWRGKKLRVRDGTRLDAPLPEAPHVYSPACAPPPS